MEPLVLPESKSTPSVRFDATTGVCEIRGECYPENAAKFFSPLFDWIKQYLASEAPPPLRFIIGLNYFNSSSSKALMNLFELLDEWSASGREVNVNWQFDPENEPIMEAGEEFKEELSSLAFHLVPISRE